MDAASTKLLETATHRTLHAHAFSRSSTQASLVLTDLLSRYLALLAATCAKYAQHAGRTDISVHDAVGALDEMGVGLDELNDYVAGEGREFARYAIWSGRRVEDLNEFKAQLHDGLGRDRDDAIPLVYAPYEEELSDDQEISDNDDQDESVSVSIIPETTRTPPRISVSTPPPPTLPLSPPLSPRHASPSPRKRPRKATWQPPDHIPDFLPPFPKPIHEEPSPAPDAFGFGTPNPPTPTPVSAAPSPIPVPGPSTDVGLGTIANGIKPPPQTPGTAVAAAVTSTSASDYLVQVPYSQSTLAQVAEWHLPAAPPHPGSSTAASSSSRLKISTNGATAPANRPVLPTPQTEPSLLAAYHHILTHPPPPFHGPSSNPTASSNAAATARHKVAMALLAQTQDNPRWEPADTLFAGPAPCPPRGGGSVGPTWPMAVDELMDGKGKDKDDKFKFPGTLPRAVVAHERLAGLVSMQGSRIPELARAVLPPTVLSRTTRLSHPPPLQRGPKLLVYGGGVPAPWNANALPPADAPPGTPALSKPKDKDKEREERDEPKEKPALPDARLYATWEVESKDFRVPLVVRRGRVGSVQHGVGKGKAVARERV
ncbi:hypothetical protein DXG03_005692 [Asterophora parasitica]|uniref:Bromodomain associated domain-containing protein n=1 Tax=Asterophora parasitica TaxID=117018 RepID=A0A9P7G1G1_9AGAR|nr:hypothetical protein DXG03_005692 [Asterophora parasitica]